jgi:hypothetical protein
MPLLFDCIQLLIIAGETKIVGEVDASPAALIKHPQILGMFRVKGPKRT